jgi:hypothetical protein
MKKRILTISGIVALALLLAGAAFVGGRLLNGKGLPAMWSGGPFLQGGGDGKDVRINVDDIQPAKELPQAPADVRGVFESRQDNSIFLGTGRVALGVQIDDQTGEVQTSSDHDGPTVEVVVTSQTTIYKDVTMKQFNGPPPEGQKIQQVVEPGSLDDIGESSLITVWGKKTGDRIIADVLVYTSPDFTTK